MPKTRCPDGGECRNYDSSISSSPDMGGCVGICIRQAIEELKCAVPKRLGVGKLAMYEDQLPKSIEAWDKWFADRANAERGQYELAMIDVLWLKEALFRNQWILCSKRMPEHNQCVDVGKIRTIPIYLVRYITTHWRMLEQSTQWSRLSPLEDFTHWRPRLAPPEEL